MLIKNPQIKKIDEQKKVFYDSMPTFNFLVAAGKIKQSLNSEIFISGSSSHINDLFRERGAFYWSNNIKNSIPNIDINANKSYFDIKIENNMKEISSQEILGQFSENITIFAKKDLFKYFPGNPIIESTTYNKQFWKAFISGEVITGSSTLVQNPQEQRFGNLSAGESNSSNTNSTTQNPQEQQLGNLQAGSAPAPNLSNLFGSQNTNQSSTQTNISIAPSPIANNTSVNNTQQQSLPFNILPTIVENKTFFDLAFEVKMPFSKKQLKKNNAPIGILYADVEPNYNFFIKSYEETLTNNELSEQLLPNMYIFSSEEKNQNTDEKNTIFKQHISLAGNIPDSFIDITNNKGEKIGEKDKGEYFDKYADSFFDLLKFNSNEQKFLINKFTNIATSIQNLDLFKDFNDKKELFPMFFDINFSTDNSTQFAQILEDSKLSGILIKDLIEGNLQPEMLNFQESIVEQKEEINKNISTKVTSEKKQIKIYDLNNWINSIVNNKISVFNTLNDGIFLGNIDEEFKLASDPSFDLYKNLLILIFVGKLKTLIDNNLRSFEDIINGKVAPSENLLYRIEKLDGITKEIIQNFYFPNSNKIDVLRFIDTQVKYNKKYSYKIYTYQMILGNKYSYKLNQVADETANINVINEPLLKMAEVLLYEFSGRIMDNPPISPEVNIIPYRGVNNQILFNINGGIGKNLLEPIIIESSDLQIINKIKEAQLAEENDLLEFETDDWAAAFEIFRLDKKPFKYQDFSGQRIALVSTDISVLTLQSATSISFVDNIMPNKKYYYTFRTIDNHGHISNPTPVFELEIVDANGSIYPIIKIVDFEKNKDLLSKSKSMKKFIQFVPAFNQKIINEQKSGLIVNGERINSILDKENIKLGVSDETVWGKTFKIRIISKNTGKKIDLNINFDHQHIRKE